MARRNDGSHYLNFFLFRVYSTFGTKVTVNISVACRGNRSFRYEVVSLQVDSLHLKSVRYTSKVIYKNREINHMKENVFQNENSRKFVSESFRQFSISYNTGMFLLPISFP